LVQGAISVGLNLRLSVISLVFWYLLDQSFLFQLLDIEDGYLSLMDDGGNTRDDLKVPEGEIGEEIKAAITDGKDILVSSVT
jgi:hypothetical protein